MKWESVALATVAVACVMVGVVYQKVYPPRVEYTDVSDQNIRLLASANLLNPIFLDHDPYLVPQTNETMNKDGYCAVKFIPGSLNYTLKTFNSEEEAQQAGWRVTHKNKCAACSSLKDLAVYLQNRDLTAPVRKCGMMSMIKPLTMNCLYRLGFTEPCAEIWYYNIRNTARNCMSICMLSWISGEPRNKPDGSLNDCLQCDEDKSGPIFQRYAGRIRRSSGIDTDIKRPDEEVSHYNHTYVTVTIVPPNSTNSTNSTLLW